MKRKHLLFLFLVFFYCGSLMAQQPVSGSYYKIKHNASNLYMGRVENLVAIQEYSGATQVFRAIETDVSGTFNLQQVSTGEYAGKDPGSGWNPLFSTNPSINETKFLFNVDQTITCVAKSTNVIATDNVTNGSTVYFDKAAGEKAYWTLEEVMLTVDLLREYTLYLINEGNDALLIEGQFGATEKTNLETAKDASQAAYNNLEITIEQLNTANTNLLTALNTYLASQIIPVFTPVVDQQYRIFSKASYRYVEHQDNATNWLKTVVNATDEIPNDDEKYLISENEGFKFVAGTIPGSYKMLAPIGGFTYHVYGRGNNAHQVRTKTAYSSADCDWSWVFVKTVDGIDYFKVNYGTTTNYLWLANSFKDPNDFKTSGPTAYININTNSGNYADTWLIGVEPINTTTPQMLKKAIGLYQKSVAGTEPGQYPTESRAALNDKIILTQSVFDNVESTETQKNTALTELFNAIVLFKSSVYKLPVLNALSVSVTSAQAAINTYYLDNRTEISNVLSQSELQSAMETAQNIIDNVTVLTTQAEVDNAVTVLNSAIQNAKPQFIPVAGRKYRINNLYTGREGYYSSQEGSISGRLKVVPFLENDPTQVWSFEPASISGRYQMRQGELVFFYDTDSNGQDYSMGEGTAPQGSEVRINFVEWNPTLTHQVFCLSAADSTRNIAVYSDLNFRSETFSVSNVAHKQDFVLAEDFTTKLSADKADEIVFYQNGNKLTFIGLQAKGDLTIFDVSGRIVSSVRVQNTEISIQIPAKGYYLVRIDSSNRKLTSGIIVR